MGRRIRRKTTSITTATLVVAAATVVAFAAVSVSSSSPGFPGTIQPPPVPSQQQSTTKSDDNSKTTNKGSSSTSSDDEAGEAGESSSDWDDALIMEEDPLAFVVNHVDAIHSHSSDGDNETESENDGEIIIGKETETEKTKPETTGESALESQEPAVSNSSVVPPSPPPLKVPSKSEAEQLGQQGDEAGDQQNDDIGKSKTPLQASQASPNSSPEEEPSQELEQQHQEEDQQGNSDTTTDSTTTISQTPKPPRRSPRNSKDHDRHPSNNKPLQTLEKLQQLLDNTDYLTSSSSTSGTGLGGEDHSQNPNHQQQVQNQQQHAQNSSKSSVPGINSLWTSKDRTKYKKQQRLQKEQIRLKHQQEDQLRKQQQQIHSLSVETEDFSDTDDGLGYTLPNLPVYLSDGEEDTDEAMFLSDQIGSARAATPKSSSSSPSLSASRLLAASQQKQQTQQQRQALTIAQQQYLQQQRDLFFAQDQQNQQQRQPPPANPLHYPNQQLSQQQQQQQQHAYYGAGPYPPPPPLGFYPYGPPPPQYYNGGPLPPQQYQPSSFYPYPSFPTIATTVPRNPRQITSALPAVNEQEQSQQRGEEESSADQDSNKSLEGEVTGDETTVSPGGVVYPQPPPPFDASYYPQSPEQQEQWHLQQLRILQAQEKYERDLRRKHQTMVMVATLRSFAVSTWKTFGSFRKVSTCLFLMTATCYASVSPRNLPYLEYNRRFYENLHKVALVVLPPLVGYGWLVVDWNQSRVQLGGAASASASNPRILSPASLPTPASAALTNGETNRHGSNGSTVIPDGDPETANSATQGGSLAGAIHNLIHSFYSSFVYGYLWVFVLEIAWTTFLRLAIFLAWEPDMFGVKLPWSKTPLSAFQGGSEARAPPFLILPWVLRDYKYRPKGITLVAADILTSCVACPIIEEFAKLRLLQWTMPLSKNFSWVQKTSKHHKKHKTKTIAEPITAATDETGAWSLDGTITNINPYIAGMLAVSLGIKWADAIRRVCMYTKVVDEQKNVYAFLRGIFPVQELCGIMTALGLARRDVLGQKMPLWKILLPATIVHSMANLRGMKPIFKWNSSAPWAEMQLSPDLFPGLFSQTALLAMEGAGVNNAPLQLPTTKLQWLGKAFPKIMWLVILVRAAGYCAKNYFMINRQAVRRATTYAGKHAAFSAELETAAKLKHTKDQYNEK